MTKQNEQYDIVINGGRVMDPESGLDGVRNVGITGGKIDIITEKPKCLPWPLRASTFSVPRCLAL